LLHLPADSHKPASVASLGSGFVGARVVLAYRASRAAVLTIAMIPARIASGKPSQRSATSARSADFSAKSAKQDAKSFPAVLEVLDSEQDAS
jgi:hypothetical protein